MSKQLPANGSDSLREKMRNMEDNKDNYSEMNDAEPMREAQTDLNGTPFRSGFIAVVGRPNVGKSTLTNRLLGQKIAAVSPRPQTTQRNQLSIITTEEAQLILIDTPGIHNPKTKMGELMNDSARSTFTDADRILWIVDATETLSDEDLAIAENFKALNVDDRVIVALNKIDLLRGKRGEAVGESYRNALPKAMFAEISAQTGAGCQELQQTLIGLLPEGPAYYDPDQITDMYEREIARDLIREALLNNLDEEIPHAIAVRIDEFIDRSETNSYVLATLLLDREGHKGIVIGKQGAMLKKIGSDARVEIEKMTGRKIYLELKVKVAKNWRNNPMILRELGFMRGK